MFRQEKSSLPFNEIQHLSGESMGFALNLRKQQQDVISAQKKKGTAQAVEVKKMPVPEGKNRDEFLVKETNCVNTQCLKNNLIYADEFHERLDLLSRLEELAAILEQQECILAESSVLYDAALKIHHDASEKMTECTTKEVQLKIRITQLRREQIKLDQEVRKLEKQKEAVIQGKLEAQQQSVGPNSDLIFHTNKKPNQACMKHNGVFKLNHDGVYSWTCCNSEEHDHGGCMEDHSVGIRSALPLVKNFYNNQLSINHPLQHGSSLFLENSVKFQHSVPNGSTVLKNNDSMFEGSYHDNKLPMARGSSIDYFSVHKPATRVLAMEPHANKSIRTSSGLLFGVAPTSSAMNGTPNKSLAASTTGGLAGPSQSQERARPTTAPGPLQRACITEMYPHLDAKIRKQQVEQRYVGVDYTKPLPEDPTSPTNHGTKVYSNYSRPYAHANANTQGHGYGHGHGLFTQSIHAHPSHSHSQLYHQRPSTAGPGGHNASMMSCISWGQSVALGESADSGDPERDVRSRGEAASKSSSRDDEGDDGGCEINFAPRTTLDTRPTGQSPPPGKAAVTAPSSAPHYAQPKSFPAGHKAMIGKQRAVPERVKLRLNRPLTSPDGYNIYHA